MNRVETSRFRLCAWTLLALAAQSVGTGVRGESLSIEFRSGGSGVLLRGAGSSQQVIARADATSGNGGRDVTREVRWTVVPDSLAVLDQGGRLMALKDGEGSVVATAPDGTTGSLPLRVQDTAIDGPLHFANQIVPLFTRYGCNGGGCHGKAAGQNGFRLSLLGFEPAEDYEHLVREARGRRLFPAAPEHSLLLLKATGQLPHGGGPRLSVDSEDYKNLVRWIRQGMPVGSDDAPSVDRLEVFPSERILPLDSAQQLVVTAHFTDGSTEDVTRRALYESNNPDLARCDERGLLTIADQPGEIGVMIRYQGHVAIFRGTLPLGATVAQLPPARNYVDEHIFARLKMVGIPPSEPSDDATFLRRVTLDIAGRLPTAAEVEQFSTSSASRQETRDAAIDRLLASPDYADFFANKWSALLRNRRTDPRQARGTFVFHDWIRDSLLANKPYDQFVREIVAASGELQENPPVAWYRQVRTLQSQLEDVSQLFLGQRLQCAQCHHHPYEKWSQADYWRFGAFFSQVAYKPGDQPGEESITHRRGLARATNKKTGQSVEPAGLGSPLPQLSADDDARVALAAWITAPDNRFFARALVNRYWKHFFGRGLVDPEDDLRDTNPPTHPELLDALAADFIASGYDLQHLVRTLARSTTYQLSAIPNEWNMRDKHHFARFQPRRLPAESLYDAIQMLLLSNSAFEGLPPGTRAVCLPDNSFNATSYFLTVFGRPESSSACECERSMEASLGQSLHLLNANELQERLAADTGRPALLARDSSRSDAAKLQDLYRLAYSRDPSPEESRAALDHLERKIASAANPDAEKIARREAWEDTLWALINTKEFLFNH